MKQIRNKKVWTDAYSETETAIEDMNVLNEFNKEGEASADEVSAAYDKAFVLIEELEFKNMLSSEEDNLDAVLQITAGAGGTESCDWAAMLLRMYKMYAEKSGFKIDTLDYQEGDVAGVKQVTIEISGEFAFGMLKSENGVHRLVRISPLILMPSDIHLLHRFTFIHW